MEDLAYIEKYFNAGVTSQQSASEAIQMILDSAVVKAPAGSYSNFSRYTRNTNQPRLVVESGRYYLVQSIGPGREAYVDITSIFDSTATVHVPSRSMQYVNVQPLVLNGPGNWNIVALKLKQ